MTTKQAQTGLEILKSACPTISVGMTTADWLHLGPEMIRIEDAGVQVVHFDVMDGVFCPMMTYGPVVVNAIRTPMLKDVHLMVYEPVDKLEAYVKAGADMVTVHAESTKHIHRCLQVLGSLENANDPDRGIVRGVALNPGTPVCVLEPLMEDLEMVLLLAVNPGWGGQSFIPSTRHKIKEGRELIEKSGRDVILALDGGIKRDNVAEMAALGVDLIVTGSAVFDGHDPAGNARAMLEAVKGA